MQVFFKSLILIISRRDTVTVFGGTFFLFVVFIIISGKANSLQTLLLLEQFTLSDRLYLAWLSFLSLESTFSLGGLLLGGLGAFLGALNITFAYLYIKTRATSLLRSHLYSGGGLLFAILGIGCAACGTALLSSLLGLLGLGALLGYLPLHGLEIGIIGLCVLAVTTYVLAKKLLTPVVC